MTKINDLKSSPARKFNRMGPKAASALLAEKMAANKAANVQKLLQSFSATQNVLNIHVIPLRNQ